MALVQPLRYDTAEDVRSRINNTVAFYKKRPVFIQHGNNALGEDRKLTVNLDDLISGERTREVHSSDEDLDVQAKPLGYVNLDGRVLYAMRAPIRKGIQCLHATNLYMYDLDGQITMSSGEHKTIPFGKMLMNDYPSLNDALTEIELGYVQKMAFGRKLALRQTGKLIKLLYINKCIGVLNRRERTFAVPERLACYIPLLKQQGANCFTCP